MNGPPDSEDRRSDQDRSPTDSERPFTDYGQFGVDMIDTRVLWQTQVWVDRLGIPHALHEMSADYLTNVIAFLRRRAPEWHLDTLIDATADLADALRHEADPAQLEPAMTQVKGLLALDPVGWIDDTPLMRELDRRLRPGAGGDTVPHSRRPPRNERSERAGNDGR